ncbi:MAG: hypothetical protein MSC31_09365 [Solirubrobacteraceae bacterium MAG38_C4-C5]|nr:hypothetical protein [Candidatus Siliceabacter maunaloa]
MAESALAAPFAGFGDEDAEVVRRVAAGETELEEIVSRIRRRIAPA